MKYPGLPLLDRRVSNHQLAAAGIACGVTVYGTVAHELAYLRVPMIACARHPHHAFDFCRTARSMDEYREFLLHPKDRVCSSDEGRSQALAFYYMHNLHGDFELRNAFVELWKSCHDKSITPAELAQHFQRWRTLPAVAAFGRNLLAAPRPSL